jgi:serine/threonine protein kinase
MNEEEIFHQALARALPEERSAYLECACAGNPALRASVEALLRANVGASGFLNAPAPALAATVDEPITERAGTVIGPYKLLEPIGEGGFGVVFLAEQTQPVRRKVALKILKPGMETRQVVARFEAERQALALMDHPNIAQVYDGGATVTGRPFFIMELVKGVPITEFCDQHQLTPRQRLELFIPVCQAVQHAHQKGIIHRDLKPSNMMVTVHDTVAVVKVIDFGVAKALGQELTDKTLFTGFTQMIGTPLYMSPEQAGQSSLDVDTRSDIYSLGVLLYELLTGTTPFDQERLKTMAYDEIRRVIREEEPPKPSTRISTLGPAAATVSANRQSDPQRLSRLCRGELDWIVMKALEKDRNRRYEAASALAADLQRYLHDEPVQACPPSAWYRFRKFARRNKATFLIAAVVVLALLLAVAGLAVNQWLVTREKTEKEQALDKALHEKARADENLLRARQAVKDYLTNVADNRLLKEANFHELRRELLESALPFYQEFVKQRSDDPELEAERGRAYGDLALIREDLGQIQQALADYDERRAIFERLAADFPGKPGYRQELANSYRNVGNGYAALNQPADAEAAYRRALTLLEALTAEYPAAHPYRRDLAGAGNNLAMLLRNLGRLNEALTLYHKAIDLQEHLIAEFPAVPVYQRDLAASQMNLASLFHDNGRNAESLTCLQRAVELLRKLAGDAPTNPQYRDLLAGALNNQSVFLRLLGRLEEGLAAQEQALHIEEKLAADFPALPGYRHDVATGHLNLGVALMELGRYEDALAAEDKAVGLLDRLVQGSPNNPTNRQGLALAHTNRGEVLHRSQRRDEALDAYRKARDLQQKLVADSPGILRYREDLGRTYNNMGDLLTELERYDEAVAVLKLALSIREKLAHDFPTAVHYAIDLAAVYGDMGNVVAAQGQLESALDWYAKALSKLEPVLAREPRLADAQRFARYTYAARAVALGKLARHAEALQDLDRALAIAEGQQDDGQERDALRLQRAVTLAHLQRHVEATAQANAVANRENASASTLYEAACVYGLSVTAARDDAPVAEQYGARAVALLRQAFVKDRTSLADMTKDKRLDSLRSRKDFQKLLQDMQARGDQ